MQQLPDIWTHRTASRAWSGPLDTEVSVRETAEHRRATLRRSLHVLSVLTRADFRARYRAQALGAIWSLLSPLVMMGIMSLVFIKVLDIRTKNFPIFVLIGLVTWEWITAALNASTQVFLTNADVIKRTVFAREVLPAAAVLSHGFNFLMASSMLLIFIPIFPGAFTFSASLLLIPVLLGLMAVLIIGVGLATSVLNVIYRDVAYLVNTALLILYWLTPIIYPLERIPDPYRSVLAWNPFGRILMSLRGVIMDGQFPDGPAWLAMVLPTMAIFGLGWSIFKRHERLVLDYV